jgi:hypothetical protein
MGEKPLICRNNRLIALAAAAAVALLLSGCSGGEAPEGEHESASATASPSIPPTPTPSPTPSPTPTRVPKGVMEGGWVTGIPDYVPKFEYGTLDRANSKIVEGSVSSVFNLCFRGVGKADVDAYCKKLEAAGYLAASAEIGNTYTLTASLERNHEIATLVVTLSEAEGVAIFTLGAPV